MVEVGLSGNTIGGGALVPENDFAPKFAWTRPLRGIRLVQHSCQAAGGIMIQTELRAQTDQHEPMAPGCVIFRFE